MSMFTIRLDDSKKQRLNDVIDEAVKEKGFSNKGDALNYIIEQYLNNLIGNVSGDYIAPNVRDVLEQIKCGYIGYENDVFICRETMAKKKEKKILVGQPETVLKDCSACIQGKQEQKQNELDKEFRKKEYKKLLQMLIGFVSIMENGLEFTSSICIADWWNKGQFTASKDGETLCCPDIDYKLVKINSMCKEKINKKTLNKPCENYVSWDTIKKIDPKIFKDISEVDIESIRKQLSRYEALEDKSKLNEKINIEADYKVIDDKEKE